ncbi:MAG: tetratricopeptide repeat protein [Candidatus Sericytochromatia bacterium]
MMSFACPRCQFQQDSRFSYCGHCGLNLSRQCTRCWQHLPLHFRYCGYCGVPQSPALAPQQQAPSVVPAMAPSETFVAPPEVFAAPPPLPAQPPAPVPTEVPAAPTAPPPVAPAPAAPAPAIAPSAVARVSERRMVAVLFCDVCGFTAMSEKLDPEEVSNIIQPLFQLCNAAISKYEGVVEKFIGDAIMALFGVPYAHEDDAERAALAALEMRDIIQTFGAELQAREGFSINMRIGLNVGTVVAGSVEALNGKNYQVLGDAINTAARMEQNALPGHILVTEEMHDLIKDSFELKADKAIQAKGKAKPLQSYELLGIRRLQQGSRGFEAREIPFVGRDDNTDMLRIKGRQVLQDAQPCFALISGDSGLGKTRLAHESFALLEAERPGLRFLQANSTSYSRSFSYFMLQNLLRSLLDTDETVAQHEVQEQLAQFLKGLQMPNATMMGHMLEYVLYPHLDIPQIKLLAPERLQQQIFKAFNEVLLQLAQLGPVFLLIDDLQWCDALSLQWLQQFQQAVWERQLSLFCCVTSRFATTSAELPLPDLNWHLSLELSPLENSHCQTLIAQVLDCPEAQLLSHLQPMCQAILERAAGNPYYIEEVLKNLLKDGLLVQSEGQNWALTCSVRDLPLPGSVQRLIMSRFDRLPDQARLSLQSLSAIGNVSPVPLAQRLLSAEAQQAEAELATLANTGFARLQQGPRGEEFIFQQALTQEVIYNTMVRRRKLLLHQQIGEALEQLHAADLHPVLDLLAYHFARSSETLKAVRYLNLSAQQAARLYANAQALEQYAHILELLAQLEASTLISVDLHNREWLRVSQLQQRVIQSRCDILLMTGAYDTLLDLVASQLENPELGPIERARLLHSKGRVLEKRSDFTAARELYEAARSLLEQQPDLREQARLWNAIGWVSRWLNDYDAAEAACQKALELLALQPDMEQIAYAHNVLGVVGFYRHDWDLALSHYRQGLEIQEQIQDLWGRANSLSNMGNVYFMTNRWEAAIQSFQESLVLREQLGDLEGISTSCNNLGHAYQELGRYAEAEPVIRKALEMYRQLNNGVGTGVAMCNLGTVYYRQQQWDAALDLLNAGVATLETHKMEAMLAEVYNHRIEITLEQAQPKATLNHLETNGPLIQTHGDPVQKGRLERLRARYHLHQGEREAARLCLQQALEWLQPTDHPVECLALYQDLAAFHTTDNAEESRYWEEASQQFRQNLQPT